MTTPRCPRCDVPLGPFRLEDGTVLDTCERCKGAWFDRGELARVMRTPDDLLDPAPENAAPARSDAPLCPKCPGVCMEKVSYGRPHTVPLERCPYCEGLWTTLAALPQMRQLVSMRGFAKRPLRAPEAPAKPANQMDEDEVPLDPDAPEHAPLTLRQALLGLPVAAAVVLALRSTMLGHYLFRGIRTTLHELGHATAAWLSSWKALPVPVGFTFTQPGRHVLLYLIFAVAFGALVHLGVRRRMYGLAAIGAVLFVLQQVCTWGLSLDAQSMLVSWSGCGGEIALGALLIALHYHRLPHRLRWNSFRNVALALGACAMVDAGVFWVEASRDHDLIPWDSVMGDCGDMAILRDRHGWTETMITNRYVTLFAACVAVVVLYWGVSVFVAHRGRVPLLVRPRKV